VNKFIRHFDLIRFYDQSSPIWWHDLVTRTCRPGERCHESGLRLAIRGGYVNFYHRGQSVAKVTLVSGEPRFEIHSKYVFTEENKDGHAVIHGDSMTAIHKSDKQLNQTYVGSETLDKWIATTKRLKEEKNIEKQFVDNVVGANGSVIDLEATFSFGNRCTRRFDMVALEEADEGVSLVFWEAKLSSDDRCRAEKESVPEVMNQIEDYRSILSDSAREDSIIKAYVTVCKLLVQFAALQGHPVDPLVAMVATGAKTLHLDPEPRLLLWYDAPKDKSQVWEGHRKKLAALGVTMQQMDEQSELRLQPISKQSSVTA
jgi:hypothetical protein